jgi:hypothetical protein
MRKERKTSASAVGRNGQGNANTGQPSIEAPNNRETIPENREFGTVGYGRPPVEHQFQPGRSGNPGGRPNNLPITRRYAEWTERPVPKGLRDRLARSVEMDLPEGFTFGDAMALKRVYDAVENIAAGREVRESIEGRATRRVAIIEPPVQPDPDELRKRILGKVIEGIYKRSKLYNMEIPALDQMAKEAGLSKAEMAEAMGDVKPDSHKEGIRDKES